MSNTSRTLNGTRKTAKVSDCSRAEGIGAVARPSAPRSERPILTSQARCITSTPGGSLAHDRFRAPSRESPTDIRLDRRSDAKTFACGYCGSERRRGRAGRETAAFRSDSPPFPQADEDESQRTRGADFSPSGKVHILLRHETVHGRCGGAGFFDGLGEWATGQKQAQT